MKRILVWDIPIRLFHMLYAASFAGAFAIAQLVDDESSVFPVHMLLGGVMVCMVVLRVLWGLLGSRWARFSTFIQGPAAVIEYLKGVLTGTGKHHVGHNPASGWAVLAMFALTIGLAVTGANMATGGEVVEELHEVFAFSFLAVVGLHVAGVVLHTLRKRENIIASMLDGHKDGEPSDAIPSGHLIVGLLFLGITGTWALGLVSGYDPIARQVTLPIIGKTIQLGEGEEGEGGEHGGHDEEGEHEEHGDDH
jgi:cytochrome b